MKAIESSPEIGAWLAQFSSDKRSVARNLLLQLRFVDESCYSTWLNNQIESLPPENRYALYSVRKFENGEVFWEEGRNGNVICRPGKSLGSEDFVNSLIGKAVKSKMDNLFDHPSLEEIRENHIRNFVLIDDGIGSGQRIVDFIDAMMKNKYFMSWWNFGLAEILVISFVRTLHSAAKIVASLPGADHPTRKFRKISKICFSSEAVYCVDAPELRWGDNHQEIYDLCAAMTCIPYLVCFGWGNVMSNWIFQHSVPDNLPGMLWHNDTNWRGLFPNRSVPGWVRPLLSEIPANNAGNINALGILELPLRLPTNLLALLALVKRGVRRTSSLALRLSCDGKRVVLLISRARDLGLLNENLRLTKVGIDQLARANTTMKPRIWNRSLYIPKSWCVGREFVQPLVTEEVIPEELAHSVKVYSLTDGDIG